MPTVLDEFVVKFSLDPSSFTAGQRQFLQQLQATKNDAQKFGNAVEASGKQIAEAFGAAKKAVLGVTTLLLGGIGIQEFTSFMTNLDAATARTARTMDISARELSNWQGAAEQVGGSAEGITGTLSSLSNEINKFSLTGQSNLLGPLTQLGVSLQGANGQMKTSTQVLLELSDAIQGMDPAKARAFLSLIGADQNTINLMINGRQALQGNLDAADKVGGTTKRSAEIAIEYQRNLSLLSRAATELGRTLFDLVAPGLVQVFNVFQKLLDPNVTGNRFSAVFKDIIASVDEFIVKAYEADAVLADFTLSPKTAANDRAIAADYRRRAAEGRAAAAAARHGWESAVGIPRQYTSEEATEELSETLGRSRGDRNKNPGNIKMGPVARAFGAVGADSQGHAIFPTWEAGNAAQAELLRRAYSGMTIEQMGSKYAEDPNWAAGVMRYGGYAPNTVPNLMDPAQMERLQAAIRRQEGTHAPAGYKAGIRSAPLPPIGAPASAVGKSSSLYDNRSNKSQTVTIETGDINMHVPGVRDANGVADAFAGELKRVVTLASWNTGLA